MPALVAAALAAGTACVAHQQQVADESTGPFDLAAWKLTLPVDAEGGLDGAAIEVKDLLGFAEPPFFTPTGTGAVRFEVPSEGAHRGRSHYPRSELREMPGGEPAAWSLSEGGTMSATLRVEQVPVKRAGAPARMIIGQIHGQDKELVRLVYDGDTIFFINSHAGPDDVEAKFWPVDAAGDEADIAVGERFSYLIDARGDVLTVEIHADGAVYRSVTPINAIWQADRFYFKAGVYINVNPDNGHGTAAATFYALDVGHSPGAGRGGLI
ncbi:MAG: polysaccharide lyase family 7 protein [Alphaproteobacteria bacterium]